MLCYRPKNRKTIASPFPSSLFSLLSFHGSFRMVSNLVFIRWQNLFQLRSLQNRHKHPQFGFIVPIRTRSAFLVVTLLIFRSLLLLLLNFLLFEYERPLIKERFPSPQINRSAQSVHFPRITVTIKLLSALSFLSLHWNCGANWTHTSGILGLLLRTVVYLTTSAASEWNGPQQMLVDWVSVWLSVCTCYLCDHDNCPL